MKLYSLLLRFLYGIIYLQAIVIQIIAWLVGDLNETYFVGNVDEASRQLVQITYECLDKAIAIGKLFRHLMFCLLIVSSLYCLI